MKSKLKYITSSRKMICSVAWEKITYNVFGLGEGGEFELQNFKLRTNEQ